CQTASEDLQLVAIDIKLHQMDAVDAMTLDKAIQGVRRRAGCGNQLTSVFRVDSTAILERPTGVDLRLNGLFECICKKDLMSPGARLQFRIERKVGLQLSEGKFSRFERENLAARSHVTSEPERVRADVCTDVEDGVALLN